MDQIINLCYRNFLFIASLALVSSNLLDFKVNVYNTTKFRIREGISIFYQQTNVTEPAGKSRQIICSGFIHIPLIMNLSISKEDDHGKNTSRLNTIHKYMPYNDSTHKFEVTYEYSVKKCSDFAKVNFSCNIAYLTRVDGKIGIKTDKVVTRIFKCEKSEHSSFLFPGQLIILLLCYIVTFMLATVILILLISNKSFLHNHIINY